MMISMIDAYFMCLHNYNYIDARDKLRMGSLCKGHTEDWSLCKGQVEVGVSMQGTC